jgi:hypothetical protein
LLIDVAEDYAAVLAELKRYRDATRLLGAAASARKRNGTPRDAAYRNELDDPISRIQQSVSQGEWKREYDSGLATAIEDVLIGVYCADLENQ